MERQDLGRGACRQYFWHRLLCFGRYRLGPAIGAEVLAPVKEGAVGHGPVTANVASFVAVKRIDGNDMELQAVTALEHLDLLGNAIANKIKDTGLAKIVGK